MADPQLAIAIERGLGKLAHAIRRSTSLYVAMSITPPEGTIDDLLANADRLATWTAGTAEATDAARVSTPLGKSFPPQD